MQLQCTQLFKFVILSEVLSSIFKKYWEVELYILNV